MSLSTLCCEPDLSFFVWTVSVSSVSDLRITEKFANFLNTELSAPFQMSCAMNNPFSCFRERESTEKVQLTSDSRLNFLNNSSLSNFSLWSGTTRGMLRNLIIGETSPNALTSGSIVGEWQLLMSVCGFYEWPEPWHQCACVELRLLHRNVAEISLFGELDRVRVFPSCSFAWDTNASPGTYCQIWKNENIIHAIFYYVSQPFRCHCPSEETQVSTKRLRTGILVLILIKIVCCALQSWHLAIFVATKSWCLVTFSIQTEQPACILRIYHTWIKPKCQHVHKCMKSCAISHEKCFAVLMGN